MIREEAIKILEYRRCLICQTCRYFHTPFVCERCNERNCKGEKEALKMAIEALKAEPKHGHWIDGVEDFLGVPARIMRCSVCGKARPMSIFANDGFAHNYCSNCGASMMDEVEE